MVSVPLLFFVFFRAFVLQARVTGKSTVPEDTVLLRVEDFTRAARRGGWGHEPGISSTGSLAYIYSFICFTW